MLLIFNLLQSGYYTTEPVASRYDAATMGMFVLIIVIGVIGYIVQARLQHVFKKYSEVPFPGGLTGAEVAEKMLRDNKIHNVKITHVSGQLTDHFNPQTMTVNLSDAVYSSRSVAAAAVACHECGHAIQHAQGYAPLALRSQLVPIVQFSSRMAMFVIIIGLVILASTQNELLCWIGAPEKQAGCRPFHSILGGNACGWLAGSAIPLPCLARAEIAAPAADNAIDRGLAVALAQGFLGLAKVTVKRCSTRPPRPSSTSRRKSWLPACG